MGMKRTPGTFKVLLAVLKWVLAHQDGTPMEVNPTTPNYSGNIFIASVTSRLNCPEYLVLHSEESQAACKLPFRKLCPDGQYGWYVEMTTGRYAFLMPAKSFDFERDRLESEGLHSDDSEPLVESRQMELGCNQITYCECKTPATAIGKRTCFRCMREVVIK